MVKKISTFVTALLLGLSANAQNPYLPLWEHVPDGEPRVFEDPDNPGKLRVYIIGSHDVRGNSYCGPDIRAWSAPVEDLSNWRDEGPIFTYHIQNQWDVMYAPDLVEIKQKDGSKVYYLYPHSRGPMREAMVCKGNRPDGPFTPLNVSEDGTRTLQGSVFGFDPSVYIETITDKNDPDYEIGFRAYGYWGFQRSSAAQIDQKTMWSVRPGTEVIPYFIPASQSYGRVREIPGAKFAVYEGEDLGTFNFFEASSIRKVGNKYVWVFSGHSGPDYGMGSSNSTLRYAYADSPIGPWKNGGVLVDSRGPVQNEDGTRLMGGYSGHNTHGSLQCVNDQWYVFYHRAPRGFGNARQSMVAPVTVINDNKTVAEGGKIQIVGYSADAPDHVWTAKDSNGHEYRGAEVTSEGFQIFGLAPYNYYSAGYACFLSNLGNQQDSWDVWDNNMEITNIKNKEIIGYKYFGFGGLKKADRGIKPFEGTAANNKTAFNLFLTPQTNESFKVQVWLDGPYANTTWNGKKIAEIVVPAGKQGQFGKYTVDVSGAVDKLGGKHAIFLVAEGADGQSLFNLRGLGFSKKGQSLECPVVPTVSIKINGEAVELPANPTRSTNQNGYVDGTNYDVNFKAIARPYNVVATSDNKNVKIDTKVENSLVKVKCTYNGKNKVYNINIPQE